MEAESCSLTEFTQETDTVVDGTRQLPSTTSDRLSLPEMFKRYDDWPRLLSVADETSKKLFYWPTLQVFCAVF